jgi:hypothetical protein
MVIVRSDVVEFLNAAAKHRMMQKQIMLVMKTLLKLAELLSLTIDQAKLALCWCKFKTKLCVVLAMQSKSTN